MTYNVLVEMDSQLISVEAENETDAVEIAIDNSLQNVVFRASIVPQAD